MSHQTDRIRDLVAALDREEKLSLVHGAADPTGTATGYLPGVERLGVPEFRLVDGPLGVRVPGEPATAFPAPIATAATFDPDLARRTGAAMGSEARAQDADVLLAPGCNLVRVPQCGRTFEYYGEDPVLSATFAAAAVEGIQSADVVATPKHFVANNQETDRAVVSADVSERALRELYLPSFHAAVEAGAGSVMCAYNRVNGTHASEHRWLLADVLEGEWGFDGYAVSDWYGTERTVAAANAGLDLEMPGVPVWEMFGAAAGIEGDDAGGGSDPAGPTDRGDGSPPDVGGMDLADVDFGEFERAMPDPRTFDYFGDALGEAIDAGEVPAERLDDMVARVLGQMAACGVLDGEQSAGELGTPAHRDLAVEVAGRGQVLLENDGVLPLEPDADVALIGPNVDEATLGGGGSSETTPVEATTTAEGVRERASAGDGDVVVERGVPRIEDKSFFDEVPGPSDAGGAGSGVDAGETAADATIEAAVAAAERADVAVVVVRDQSSEALDRPDLRLPGDQDELVAAVAAATDRTVVVLQSSGPVEVPWREDVAAVLASWYPGQADGEALAAVLYGDVDPGGRLPVTFAPAGDYPATDPEAYPGVDGVAHYDEGVFVGYRHFDAAGIEPTYPFGHGHSYADFEYRGVEAVDDGTVRATVANVTDRDGREVVQAYVRPPAVADVERPEGELAGFAAVDVPAGERVTVDLALDDLAFRRWDDEEGWTVDPGPYEVEVGRSSRDVRGSVTVER